VPDIRPKQIRLIKIAQKQLGLGDEEYRELLCFRYPDCFKGSCKELSYDQASDLIDHFKTLGFVIRKKPRKARPKRLPAITDMITRGQRAKINALAGDIQWHAGETKGLRGFCRRQLGVDHPRTEGEAQRFIEHLKHLRASQQRKKA